MPKLGGFGDEISASIAEQIEVMQSVGVNALELRAAEGQGVLQLDGAEREEVRQRLADAGVTVFSIGSPVGKTKIEEPFEAVLAQLHRAIEQAHYFGTSRIRVFSFYMDQSTLDEHREEVIERLATMAEVAVAADVLLCHENESGLYGQSVERCRDLLTAVDSRAFRAVHDTCNWVSHGEEAYPAGYEALRPWLEYVHIKDWGANAVQPAGEGEGRMPELFAALQASGWDGYLSLEPHLGGGPDNFRRAALALQRCLDALDWRWE